MRFISPKTDFAFKKIFGSEQSKDILISFLNAIIYSGEDKIQDLEIMDPYNAPTTVYLKDTYLDVKAVLDDKTKVIIEMQVESVEGFYKRIMYNLSKTYANQLETGVGYLGLNPVIALTITDFNMLKNTDKVITHFSFIEEEEGFIYRDDEMKMVFVELPKFKKELAELESITDKWIYFIKEAPSLPKIPETMETVPPLKKAMEIAQRVQLTPEEEERLHKQELFFQDQKGVAIKARREGLEKGRQEGLEVGLQEGRLEGERKIQKIILRQIQRRFGTIEKEAMTLIEQLSPEDLERLGEAIFDFNESEDLLNYLQNHFRV